MSTSSRLLADPWLRGAALAGALLLAVEAIVGLPWPLWFAWTYVALLSAWEVVRGEHRDRRDPTP